LQVNETKAKLKAGETVLGCFVRDPVPGLVEFLGYQPWDFLVFDGEHGVMQPADCENMVRAAEGRGVTPIARVTTNQTHIILRFMDTGAQGLHVPWVNSGEEAEAVVQAVKYFPRGIRGLAGSRAADYGQTVSLAEYTEIANRETLVIVHVETRTAVENIEAIAGVDGIDVVFIGPTDLSHSYGYPGQPQHPDVQAGMNHVVDVVKDMRDTHLGIMVGNAAGAQEWKERGAQYITTTVGALLVPAMRDYLGAVRG
jgi:4-hydroxy-2-oxoheptanedioate aldolase